jgi:hypothetical protein
MKESVLKTNKKIFTTKKKISFYADDVGINILTKLASKLTRFNTKKTFMNHSLHLSEFNYIKLETKI